MATQQYTPKFQIKGKITAGCKAVSAKCNTCKKDVTALKLNGTFQCPTCNGPVTVNPGAQEGMASLDYFLVPEEVATKLGKKPATMNIIPAASTANGALRWGYAKFVQSRKHPVCYGDGIKAQRWNFEKKLYEDVECSANCEEIAKKCCYFSSTFSFLIPDVNMMAAYQITSKSLQSRDNLLDTLLKLESLGILGKAVCELKLIRKTRKTQNTIYRVLHLDAPQISMETLQQLKGSNDSTLIGYSPAVKQ